MMEAQLSSFRVLFPFLLLIFMVWRSWKKSKGKDLTQNLPPGPWKIPVIGNLHQFVGSLPHRCLRDLAERYGPLMHLQLGEVQNVVVSSPETVQEILKTHDIIFSQRPLILGASVVVYNGTDIAFAPYGEYWRQLRKICILELLSAKRVQSFRSIRDEEVSNLIRCISSSAGSLINLSRMLFSLMYSITSRAAFGKIRKEQEAFVTFVKELVATGAGFSIADLFPSSKLLQKISGMRPKLERLHRESDKIIENIIHEHVAKKSAPPTGHEAEADDLVDVLLNVQDHLNLEFPLTKDNIKAIILDMFIAGSETSSTTVEWVMSELMKNPRVMEKTQAEVRQVFGRNGSVDEEGLGELTYLKLVIKEALRLHPPLPLLLPRESRDQCQINGYQIPVKCRVIINAWAIGRDPNYWAEPETFSPERFLDNTIDYKGANFEFIPFGAGRRMCPGILFGMANVDLPLARLLFHFDWKLPSGLKPENLDMTEAFGATVGRKKGLHLIPMPYLAVLNE